MQPTTAILDRIMRNSRKNNEETFTRLYRYMLRPDLYYLAYNKLYRNKGAATKGVDDDTADGFSEEKINRIIQSLADETYMPKPVRREYIPKKRSSTKKRPLGLPSFTDKLVQEVLRMILEAVYEPTFSDFSHGFRPHRDCHTALKALKKEFTGVSWFIEGDIKGCFDNIDHQVLVGVISSKIGGVTILLKSKNKYGTIKEKREKNEMATTVVKCPYCGSEEVSLYGKSSTGAQRYLCRNKACSHKTFQLEYKNNASKPGTKEKIIDMTMNGAGTRDTGRVLRISPNTVTGVLKKRKNLQNQ